MLHVSNITKLLFIWYTADPAINTHQSISQSQKSIDIVEKEYKLLYVYNYYLNYLCAILLLPFICFNHVSEWLHVVLLIVYW